jgi:guanylate kinase
MSLGNGKLIVISAPSGSGKTTIAREIMKLNPSLDFSVSATTRARRNTEVDGKDYFFLSKEEFMRRVRGGAFVEWEELYGQYYGTLKHEVENALHHGRNLLFDVDVKGALSIKRQYPDALMIFIRPPSVEVLVQRLKNRKSESDTTLAKRLERVPMELEMGNRFDHQIVNDELARAVAAVQTIVQQHLQRE